MNENRLQQLRNEILTLAQENRLADLATLLNNITRETFPVQISEKTTLSVDERYRVLLKNQPREVKMSSLPKSVYILFLCHPEGIVLKDIDEYRSELLHIYLTISSRVDIAQLNRSINDLTQPGSESLNQKISRINAAFNKALAPDIAQYYTISGPRGGIKRIRVAAEVQLPTELLCS